MIAAGNRRRLDLGELNGRRFVLMVSAGFDAEVVHRVHRSRRGHLSHWSYVPAVVQALWGYAHPQMRVWSGRETSPAPARLVIVVNFPRYALGLRVASGARTDDGLLDARLFARGSRFQMLRYFCSLWWSRPEKLADVACLTTSELRLESDQPVPLQADGDPAGTTPAVLRVLPGALELLVPAPTGSHTARADAKGME
jgi:diacylglycerol kinase family enzyme